MQYSSWILTAVMASSAFGSFINDLSDQHASVSMRVKYGERKCEKHVERIWDQEADKCRTDEQFEEKYK